MLNSEYTVIDNTLSFSERIILNDSFFKDRGNIASYWIKKEELINVSPIHTLVNISLTKFNFNTYSGVEIWTHNHTSPSWHTDKNEWLFHNQCITSYPMCTIVYYHTVKFKDVGVHNFFDAFQTQDVMILPKENRTIILAPGLLHTGGGRENIRQLISITPWEKKPYGLS